jgi:hypothetical protein
VPFPKKYAAHGGQDNETEPSQVGAGRYYETMTFHSDVNDKEYHDADVMRRVTFKSKSRVGRMDGDNEANEMHEKVVVEITRRLARGEL